MLHENLKALRKARGLTQVQLAKAVHISERQYQNLESGGSKPNFDSLIAIADFLDVSLDELVGRTPRKKQEAE